MMVAYPFHKNKFPDYKGILNESYQIEKEKLVNKVLKEIINKNKGIDKPPTAIDTYKYDVHKEMQKRINTNED